MLWLFRYFSGYLVVEFSGVYCEQILNLTAKNRISLWKLHCKKSCISGCILVKNFKKLRLIKRGTHIHVRVTKKCGFPFFAARYRKRVGFIAGAALFFAALKLMSGFIWTVEVEGNSAVSEEKILSRCREIGIYEGVRAAGIDTSHQAQKLLLKTPELAWASLNIEGCLITVNVTEVKRADSEKRGTPSNLRATADGVIKKIDITSGNPLVRVGDTVGRGDLLVSGIIESMSSTVFVRSAGTVTAQTERELTASAPFVKTVTAPTGEVKKRAVLSFFGIRVPLYIGAVREESSSALKELRAGLFGRRLPVSLFVRTFELTERVRVVYTREELTEILENDIENQLAQLGIKEYETKSEEYTERKQDIILKKLILTDENIAFEEQIIINNVN